MIQIQSSEINGKQSNDGYIQRKIQGIIDIRLKAEKFDTTVSLYKLLRAFTFPLHLKHCFSLILRNQDLYHSQIDTETFKNDHSNIQANHHFSCQFLSKLTQSSEIKGESSL